METMQKSGIDLHLKTLIGRWTGQDRPRYGAEGEMLSYYEIDSEVSKFYAGYMPEMLQKEAGNDASWREVA